MKLTIVCVFLLLAGCEKAVNCPEQFDWERQEFEACLQRSPECTLSRKQTERLEEERIACKNGVTGTEGDLKP